jgi:hypothetical protein
VGGEEILVQHLSLLVEIALGHLEHLRGDQLQRGSSMAVKRPWPGGQIAASSGR